MLKETAIFSLFYHIVRVVPYNCLKNIKIDEFFKANSAIFQLNFTFLVLLRGCGNIILHKHMHM